MRKNTVVPVPEALRKRAPRNAVATSERILQAAIQEFAENGYMGARIDAIAKRADANMRMLYHYFGNKSGLYLKVLENVFGDIRQQELMLNLQDAAPLEAITKLFEFTYAHFASNPLFVRILTGENLANARHLHESALVPSLSSPLLTEIRKVLERGEREGVFKRGLDPLQLYVSIVSLSYFHISNGPTLSWIFSADLQDASWREARREHARSMLLCYLLIDPSKVAEGLGSKLESKLAVELESNLNPSAVASSGPLTPAVSQRRIKKNAVAGSQS